MNMFWKLIFTLSFCMQISSIHSRAAGIRQIDPGDGIANRDGNALPNNFDKSEFEDKETKIGGRNADGTRATFMKHSQKALGSSIVDGHVQTDSSGESILPGKGKSGNMKDLNIVTKTSHAANGLFGEHLNKPTNIVEPGMSKGLIQKSSKEDAGKRIEVETAQPDNTGNIFIRNNLNDPVKGKTSGSSLGGKSDNPQSVSSTSLDTHHRSNVMKDSSKFLATSIDTGKGAGIRSKTSSFSKNSGKASSSVLGGLTDDDEMDAKPKDSVESASTKAKSESSNLNMQRTGTGLHIDERIVPKGGMSDGGTTGVSSRRRDRPEFMKSNSSKSLIEQGKIRVSGNPKRNSSINRIEPNRNQDAKATNQKLYTEVRGETAGKLTGKLTGILGDKSAVENEKPKDGKVNDDKAVAEEGRLGGISTSARKEKLKDDKTDGSGSVEEGRLGGISTSARKEKPKDNKTDGRGSVEEGRLGGISTSSRKEKPKDEKTDGRGSVEEGRLGGISTSARKEKPKDNKTDGRGSVEEGRLGGIRSNMDSRKPTKDARTGVAGTTSDRENQKIPGISDNSKANRLRIEKPSDSRTYNGTSSRDRTGIASSQINKTTTVKDKSKPPYKADDNTSQIARLPKAGKRISVTDLNSDQSVQLQKPGKEVLVDGRLDVSQRGRSVLDKPLKGSKNDIDRHIEERRRKRLRKMRIYSEDNDQRVKSSHFIVYGTIGLILLIVLYVVYQKRQKILALIVEGRRQRGNSGSGERSRRGSGSIAYKPLPSKEEPADERPESLQKYIY